MCKDCGCEEANKEFFQKGKMHHHGDGNWHSHDDQHATKHEHEHEHNHEHNHEHENADHSHHHNDDHAHNHSHKHHDKHEHDHDAHSHRVINTAQSLLAKNDEIAQNNRMWFLKNKMLCLNFISSPGSGKTLLLEKTLLLLSKKNKVAVLVGDQATSLDADRLQNKGAFVKQINTHSSCHLDAPHIQKELSHSISDDTNILIIENVGNLVCPSAFDLGETAKIALLSCTEGEDKPVKYPVLFSQAQAIIITKIDLAPHLNWSLEKTKTQIRKLNSFAPIFVVSSQTGEGLEEWTKWIEERLVQIQKM